ncbi:MAG: hypothetical protein WCH57_09675 [Verrucomicrobiota bacterium]
MKNASLPKSQTPLQQNFSFGLNRNDVLRIVLLALIAAVCWCYVTGRTNGAAWQVPLEYGVKGPDADAQSALATLKIASEGEYHLFAPIEISRLSAPYHAFWSDFPSIEKWISLWSGFLARFIGIFAAANAAVLAAQVLACISFYIAARLLDCKWWWALAGGFVFGFAQYALARSIHHLCLTYYWHVPLCLVIATWITRNELGDFGGRRYVFALAVSLAAGVQNAYYTNMFLQLVLLGAFYQYFRQGWKPVLQAGGIVAAAAGGFLLMNVDMMVFHLTHGPNPGSVVRPYMWLELYSLKFVDMLVPPPDHPLFGALGQAYCKAVAIPCEVPPSCYLGLLGIGSLCWLAVVSVRRLVVQTGRNLPMEAWQVLWILAYSAIGGLNCLAGVFGITIFRSTTRYSIFILPILLLFALKRLSKMRQEREIGFTLAALCALVAFWDQTPPVATEAKIAEVAQVVHADRDFAQKLEARLPKGAMIFQVPIMEFPESPAPGVSGYDHLRLYLHSKDLRFSFGGIKGRPWLQWQKDIAQQALPDFIRTLESYGFSAIYVNRNGFQDKGEGVLKAVRNLGYTDVLESSLGDLFCVLIHPSPHPLLPAGTVH